jgi:type VI secretion system protein ImpF
MARYEPDPNVTLSVLDRLIDLTPNARTDPAVNRANTVRQLKASLRRDLEWLLNTRQTPEAVLEGELEIRKSLWNYGLPDTTTMGIHSTQDQNRLTWMLETAVTIFEPRLMGVRVSLEPVAGSARILRFQIQGLLKMDPAPERVSFDTVLELTKGEYAVRGD